MNIIIYPREKKKKYEQNFIYKNFAFYINDNNINCNLIRDNISNKEIIDNIDFVITFGITDYKSILNKYKKNGINGINMDSSSYNHLKFVTLNCIRPPIGKYLGFTNSLLDKYDRKFVFKNRELKDFRNTGEHILICLDYIDCVCWSSNNKMTNSDKFNLIINTIIKIKKYSDKNIIIRFHPIEKKKNKIIDLLADLNIRVSKTKKISDDLNNCWFAICFNSAAVCLEFVLAGIPFNCLETNIGYDISIPIEKINDLNINTFDRNLFLDKISYSLWHYGNSYYLAHHLFKYVFPVIFKSNQKIMKILENKDIFKLYTDKYLDKLENRDTFYKAIFD